MSPFAFELLRRLADAEFHSGAALARALGVSRGTVWNGIRAIEATGLTVYRVSGRGYRLAQPLSLLEPRAIARHAGGHAARLAIEVVDTIDSTSSALVRRAAAGAPCGTLLAAEWQANGRGRMGRSWHAGLGEGIAFSLLRRFTQGAGALAGLSLAAGVALARALLGQGADGVELKWPNDVVWRGEKLAGMLVEMQGDALGPSAAVIGIGINVRLSETVRARIDQPCTDLAAACARAIDRNVVLGRVAAELVAVLDAFSRDGFAPLAREWQRYHAHQDRPIAVTLPGGRVEHGIARGVADDGALLFETREGVRRVMSGEVSVRSATDAHASL